MAPTHRMVLLVVTGIADTACPRSLGPFYIVIVSFYIKLLYKNGSRLLGHTVVKVKGKYRKAKQRLKIGQFRFQLRNLTAFKKPCLPFLTQRGLCIIFIIIKKLSHFHIVQILWEALLYNT